MSGIAISQCICVCVYVCAWKKHAIHLVMFPSFQVNKQKYNVLQLFRCVLKEQNTSGRQQNPKTNRVELKAILTTPARKKCGTQFWRNEVERSKREDTAKTATTTTIRTTMITRTMTTTTTALMQSMIQVEQKENKFRYRVNEMRSFLFDAKHSEHIAYANSIVRFYQPKFSNIDCFKCQIAKIKQTIKYVIHMAFELLA